MPAITVAGIFNINFMISKLKLLAISFMLMVFLNTQAFAWVVDTSKLWLWNKIVQQSIAVWAWSWWTLRNEDTLTRLSDGWLSVLHSLKLILSWLIVIYLIYLGFQMVMALWAEDKMKWAKVQIYYTLLAFLFINIPWQIYEVFSWKQNNDVTNAWWAWFADVNRDWHSNVLVNFSTWNYTVETWVISFIKVIIVWVVTLMFIIWWLWLITSWWNDEKRKKARARFVNWILWLVFVWIIQAWVSVVYHGNIEQWQNLFAQLSNLAIFFAGPVAIFFLIMWGFYYITAAWDEAKSKKGTLIIKNTFVAVIILLASYAFLKDVANFSIN